jgi:hypothetical protein
MRSAIQEYLSTDLSSSSVLAHGERLLKLNGIAKNALPCSLQGAIRVGNFKSNKVIILVENGSIATKLRQMGSRILSGFRAAGFECNEVEIKVQPTEKPFESKRSRIPTISTAGCNSLSSFAATLAPDTSLRLAIERLISRSSHTN